MTFSLFPNQIDNPDVNVSEALIAIENVLGTNPSGSDFSTIGSRLKSIEDNIKTLSVLSNKEHLYDLKLSTLLSLGNTTDGYDIILSSGDAITSSDNKVNIIGEVIITGDLNISNDIYLNNSNIKKLKYPNEPDDASTKSYVDDELKKHTDILKNKIYSVISRGTSSIQYAKGETQPIPKTEANKYLKRNIDNTNWEFVDLDVQGFHDKIDSVIKSIGFISKNITNGEDLKISIGDAIKGEDDYVNIDSHVIIHKTLLVNGDIDLQSHRISNSMPPIFKSDLTNRQYVDTKIQEYINSRFSIENQTIGSILYFNGNTWISLSPGNEGEILMMKNNLPAWCELNKNG